MEWSDLTMDGIKTLLDWERFTADTGKDGFADYFKAGDEVGKDVYECFLNAVPPVFIARGYYQVGEAYGCEFVNGKVRNTYHTFEKDGDRYFYRGALPYRYRMENDGKLHRF